MFMPHLVFNPTLAAESTDELILKGPFVMTGYISLAPPASHNNNKREALSTSHTEFHLLSATLEKQEAGGVQVLCTLHHPHGT